VLAEAAEATRGSHVTGLPALVERAVARAGLAVGDIEAVAVSIGPGSFTGLRVGLAFAKGLVFAGGLPLATVPTLEALAHVADAPAGTLVCAALDARKREVYAALFRVDAAGRPVRLTPDRALAPDALARELPPGCVLVGDGAEAYAAALAGAGAVRPFAAHPPRGGVVARLGEERLAAGDAADPGTVEPAYVRPPEAELPKPGSR
jgi:tRNA threonylcarbamoyladenosine biosynthesis protein TsaB